MVLLLLLYLFRLRIENYLSTLTDHNLVLLPTLASDLQNLSWPGWIYPALGCHNYLPGNYLLPGSKRSSGSY